MRTVLAALVITGAVFFLSYCYAEKGRNLEIRDALSGRVYGKLPLDGKGESAGKGEFSIEFVHSVNQSPVRETFVVEGRRIRPFSVRFSSFGAGMQSDLEEGQVLSRDGEALVITGFKTSFIELNYIVGTVSDHLLIIDNKTISLREICGRNAHITIRVK